MKKSSSITILIVLFLWVQVISAQDSCNADLQIAISRAYGACTTLERNQACYGGGIVTSQFQSTAGDNAFLKAGDKIALHDLRQIALESRASDNWSSAFLRLQANLSTSSQRSAIGILFGSASLTNHVEALPRLSLSPRGTLNIRSLPQGNADIIGKVNVNGEIIANGRNEDNSWLRVYVPNSDQLGWISTELAIAEADIHQLRLVTAADRVKQPFEQLTLQSSPDILCDGAPPSGLLLQSPSLEESMSIQINGAIFNLAGTAFLQAVADDVMTIHMLEGTATISAFEDIKRLKAGARLQIPVDSEAQIRAQALDITPYDLVDFQFTPYLYLDRRIQPPQALTSDALAELNTALTPIPESSTIVSEKGCQYIVTISQNIRNGPSLEYDVTQSINPNTIIYPRAQTQDINGVSWLQVGRRAWIQSLRVESRGDCVPLPVLSIDNVIASTRNTLSLEACESTNGPIEVGQRVTIEFIPRAFENFFTAQEATRYSKGQIFVGDRRFYPYVSDPIKISEHEFIRRFYAEWKAELGTYRIEGSHYAYEIICTITVVSGS